MKKEDIEKEARSYSSIMVGGPRHLSDFYEREKYEVGFEAGAEWRINSVWHDASEVPEKKPALVEYSHFPKGHGYLVVPDPREVLGSITRYAYIEELIPNTEE